MIQFTKLRINGFKSFVDRTELEIAPGLNGVVGPNGCGKSNLVEAVRWVMGESSAKRMRGGGMEDVIFAGTGKRAARNIAEVTLLMDNTTRQAPAAYNGSDEIEIIRRIERDRGSNYKINGKNVRARDVQMLFADSVTGANSPALVSQGRVTQIINAKPQERRLILEESAGISGLYARRHEAELRLKAADNNLARIEDVAGGMESRLNALKRQARQANRYRNASAQIRQLELLIVWLEWTDLESRTKDMRKIFSEAETRVAHNLITVTQLTKTHNTLMEDIQPLRQKESEIAAKLQHQKLALQRLEDEILYAQEQREQIIAQTEQAKTDLEHEQQMMQEYELALKRLKDEHKALGEKQDDASRLLKKKQGAREELERKVLKLEESYTALMQNEAESKARLQSLNQQIEQNTQRLNIVLERRAVAQNELEQITESQNKEDEATKKESNVNELSGLLDTVNKEKNDLLAQAEACKQTIASARGVLHASETTLSGYNAEVKILESFFQKNDTASFAPVLDSIQTKNGFEKALSRALGDTLMASLDPDAPEKWLERPKPIDTPALPKNALPLQDQVKAPPALRLALSQIGLVETEAQGHALMEDLKAGQSLVSPEGSYWRWDGYYIQAQASDRNSVYLEQKNKLVSLEKKRPEIEEKVNDAQEALDKAIKEQQGCDASLEAFNLAIEETSREIATEKEALALLKEGYERQKIQKQHLTEKLETATQDIQTLEDVIRWDTQRLQACEKETQSNQSHDLEVLKETLLEARTAHQKAVSALNVHEQEVSSRKARLHAIADERINLQNQQIRSRERVKELESRLSSLHEKQEQAKTQPNSHDDNKQKLLSAISTIEKNRQDAADLLLARESDAVQTSQSLKDAERALSEEREKRAHASAKTGAMEEQKKAMETRIDEEFDIPPSELHEHVTIPDQSQSLDTLKQQKEKLVRERDSIGPVNLRADEEAVELEKEVSELLNERNDLTQAIEELRAGIQKINKEARGRLLAAFEHINAHFKHLFSRLFAGGQAHLALIDSDDPLGAGLEIFAQPPGKKLQSLSLLSGGEQTLASIALIFAMFLTNPSPICVLDEIDAPLDDANVDRVCNLLEEISARGETRFLVITHHRLTMARMDRLYGITMGEKGVSQLVSVDLQQSFEFLDEVA